jgi:hypothetical protein
VSPDKKKFQCPHVLPEQQAQFQARATLKDIFPQSPDGNTAVNMWVTEAIRDNPEHGRNAVNVRVA